MKTHLQKTVKRRSFFFKSVLMMRTNFSSMFPALLAGFMSICAVQNLQAQELFTVCDRYNYVTVGNYFALRDINLQKNIDLGNLTLPDTMTCAISYVGVKTAPVEQLGWGNPICSYLINANATYKVTVTGITLPLSCKRIAQHCFNNKSGVDFPLQSLDAPGVTQIDVLAFNNQSNLSSVNLSSIEKIGDRAFANCPALTSITLPTTLKEIGMFAFENSGLTSLTLQSAEAIGSKAFKGTAIETITLPPNLRMLPETALAHCANLTTIYYNCPALPTYVDAINAGYLNGFEYLENPNCHIIIGTNLDCIKEFAFASSKAAAYTIPNTIKYIGKGAFGANNNLKKIEIPSSVDSIHYAAFSGCSNLEQITVHWQTPLEIIYSITENYIPRYGLYGITHSNITLIVPCGTSELYEASETWKDFTIVEDCGGITLSQLSISAGTLNPAFNPAVYNYTVHVDNSVSSIDIMATPTNQGATISGDTGTLPLNVGANPFTLTVTEEEKPAQNYTITVYRAGKTGISETEAGKIKIYPNPVKDELRIENGELTINKITIADLSGKTIQQITGSQKQINISALSSGIYFLKIETDKGVVTRKFVKE